MKVLIAGGGNVGRYLGRLLVQNGHDVTVIDHDERRLAQVRDQSGATAVLGDAAEPSVLEESGIRGMDVVVAATGHDEDNLVVASLAKFEFDVPRVVARVKNAMNAWLYEPDMGVDVLVSAPHTIAQLIEERVTVGDVVQLLELAYGRAALLEATLPPDSPVVGEAASDVRWPPDCVVSAVLRGTAVLAPAGNVTLQPGDRVLCIADAAQVDALHGLLGTVRA
jgi:trk system potassium uptake protein TrkA